MAKVDWISWKTETDEIINPEKTFEEWKSIHQIILPKQLKSFDSSIVVVP